MRSKVIAVSAVGLLAASCTHIDPATQSPDPQFGEAVKYDMAIQVINPDPVYTADMAKPGDNGDKGAAAVERYRTDQVKDAKPVKTNESGSEAGAGLQPPR